MQLNLILHRKTNKRRLKPSKWIIFLFLVFQYSSCLSQIIYKVNSYCRNPENTYSSNSKPQIQPSYLEKSKKRSKLPKAPWNAKHKNRRKNNKNRQDRNHNQRSKRQIEGHEDISLAQTFNPDFSCQCQKEANFTADCSSNYIQYLDFTRLPKKIDSLNLSNNFVSSFTFLKDDNFDKFLAENPEISRPRKISEFLTRPDSDARNRRYKLTQLSEFKQLKILNYDNNQINENLCTFAKHVVETSPVYRQFYDYFLKSGMSFQDEENSNFDFQHLYASQKLFESLKVAAGQSDSELISQAKITDLRLRDIPKDSFLTSKRDKRQETQLHLVKDVENPYNNLPCSDVNTKFYLDYFRLDLPKLTNLSISTNSLRNIPVMVNDNLLDLDISNNQMSVLTDGLLDFWVIFRSHRLSASKRNSVRTSIGRR